MKIRLKLMFRLIKGEYEMYWLVSTAAVLTGVVLDLIFGDPNVWWHPICLIGRLISKMENILRRETMKEKTLLVRGAWMVMIVCAVSTALPTMILLICWKIHWGVFFIAESFFSWFLLAARCLKKESMKVYYALSNSGLDAGRAAVSMIVGRDTGGLTEEGVVKAAVETVAENTSDGVIAPLFYMMIGGSSLGFLYKSINTMDSMVGYKNEKYLYFGRCAAKADDAANFIPSRLSAIFMILGSFFCGYCVKDAWRIYRRDRKKHASPNAAQTESVMAGALGVRLAGNACYFGKLYEKEYIGDVKREIGREDIIRANQLMYHTLFVGVFVFTLCKMLMIAFI